MACCPCCDEPLVVTLAFRFKEFYCVCCGATWGFLDPNPKDPTPDLMARADELREEWVQLSKGLVTQGRAIIDAAAHQAAIDRLNKRADAEHRAA